MPTNDLQWLDVVAMVPKLSKVDVLVQTSILGYVNQIGTTVMNTTLSWLGDSCLNTSYSIISPGDLPLARVLLAAHLGLATQRGAGGASGPVTSEATGGLRRSYGLVALSPGLFGLGSTEYGMQFLAIIALSSAHGPFIC